MAEEEIEKIEFTAEHDFTAQFSVLPKEMHLMEVPKEQCGFCASKETDHLIQMKNLPKQLPEDIILTWICEDCFKSSQHAH